MEYYLTIENNSIGFCPKEEIIEGGVLISQEEYQMYFELKSKGKEFKPKLQPTGIDLFDYIEEYIVAPVEAPKSEVEMLREKIAIQDSAIMELAEIISTMNGGV